MVAIRGSTDFPVLYSTNTVAEFFEGLDDFCDDGVGFRPFRPLARVFKFTGVANLVNDKTNVPKPSQFVENIQNQIESTIGGFIGGLGSVPLLGGAGGIKMPPMPPAPPGFPKIFG
jgi:hypothetical protein